MTAFHLVRAPIDIRALAKWSAARGWATGRRGLAVDEGRALHHLVDEMFGPRSLRPFRLLVPPRGRSGNLYAYSPDDAASLRAAADRLAKPDHLAVLPIGRLDGKSMPTAWPEDRRIGFDLRARPTRRLREPLRTGADVIPQGAELDAFQCEALRRFPDDPDGMARAGLTREAVYLDWLADRLAGAASLDRDATRLVRFRRSVVARGRSTSEGPDAVFHGTLTVVDGPAFARRLSGGVGRHCGYGYGMLLLAAAQRPLPER